MTNRTPQLSQFGENFRFCYLQPIDVNCASAGSKLLTRFWAKVDRDGPVPEYRASLGNCWIWTGGRSRGYGLFRLDGQLKPAHVVSFLLTGQEIPAGYQLDHLCRVPACVRPDHLEPVTPSENLRRSPIVGRHLRKVLPLEEKQRRDVARSKRWRLANPERYREYMREYMRERRKGVTA